MPPPLLLNLLIISLACSLLWGVSLLRRDSSIVDIFWGIGFVIVGWATYLSCSHATLQAAVLLGLVTLWGARLAGYLGWRNWGKEEDYRYAAMRTKHGKNYPLVSLVTVFALQGGLIWFISLPIQLGIPVASSWYAWDFAGITLWLIGFTCESVGDWQLARFKANPANRGKVMDRGLWRYTRHPNYFGDFLVWWGIYLVAAEPPTCWWTIASPLLMSFLLIRVSGVRLLENSLRASKPGYAAYIAKTSSFFPLPPKPGVDK